MESKLIINNNERVMTNLLKREAERQFELQKKRIEKKLINPEHEQYNYFTQVFQEKVKQIEFWVEQSNVIVPKELAFHFDKIWKELHALQKFIADSLLFLREYDIRICQKSLQDIEIKTRQLEERLLPKKKFGFKNKRPTVTTDRTSKDEIDNVCMKHIDNIADKRFYGFKDEANTTLLLSDESLFQKDVSLQNLNKCLVKLHGAASTLHMSNLEGCVVLCGPVATSVFAENCNNCTFAIVCQQLRLHSSNNCEIYLHVTSKAIIEDSKEIRVAEYNYDYQNLPEDFQKANLDRTTNNWSHIDDFNWLVLDKHSPNWNILDATNQIANWRNFQLK